MKLYNIKDVNEFYKMIDSCKGTVMLVTPEGDRLNLKSKLSQYVSLTSFFASGKGLADIFGITNLFKGL